MAETAAVAESQERLSGALKTGTSFNKNKDENMKRTSAVRFAEGVKEGADDEDGEQQQKVDDEEETKGEPKGETEETKKVAEDSIKSVEGKDLDTEEKSSQKLRNIDESEEEKKSDDSDFIKRRTELDEDASDDDVLVSKSELTGSDDSDPNTDVMMDRPASMFTEKAAKAFEENRYDQKFVLERSGEIYE